MPTKQDSQKPYRAARRVGDAAKKPKLANTSTMKKNTFREGRAKIPGCSAKKHTEQQAAPPAASASASASTSSAAAASAAAPAAPVAERRLKRGLRFKLVTPVHYGGMRPAPAGTTGTTDGTFATNGEHRIRLDPRHWAGEYIGPPPCDADGYALPSRPRTMDPYRAYCSAPRSALVFLYDREGKVQKWPEYESYKRRNRMMNDMIDSGADMMYPDKSVTEMMYGV